jgi:hypothetical protein
MISVICNVGSADSVNGHTKWIPEERIRAYAIVASGRASACHSEDGQIRKYGANFLIVPICNVLSAECVHGHTKRIIEERIRADAIVASTQ